MTETTTDGYMLIERSRVVWTDVVVRRPDGTIETIPAPRWRMNPELRAKATQLTREAGRGDIIDWIERTETYTVRSCSHYSADQGCPLHGETCTGRR